MSIRGHEILASGGATWVVAALKKDYPAHPEGGGVAHTL